MQLGDDIQVRDQSAQLGGGAQVELGAFVDVERLVVVVGLHPKVVAVKAALVQGEAVHHTGRVTPRQQLLVVEAQRLRLRRVAQALQQRGHRGLHRCIEGAGDIEVQAVKVVKIAAHQPGEVGTHRGGRFLGDERHIRLRHATGATLQLSRQGRVAQGGRDDLRRGQQTQVAVCQSFQLGFWCLKVIRRSALGDQQTQRLLVKQAHLLKVALARRIVFQNAPHLSEVPAIPSPQAVPNAMHLAKAHLGRQGHGV